MAGLSRSDTNPTDTTDTTDPTDPTDPTDATADATADATGEDGLTPVAEERDATLTTVTTVGSLAVAVVLSLVGMWVGAVACPQGSCTPAGQNVASYLPPVLPLVIWAVGALVARTRRFNGRRGSWAPLVAVAVMLVSSGVLASRLV